MTPDISVVITLHGEGRVFVPTLRSVSAAVHCAQASGHVIEVVLVLDRADSETYRVVDVHAAQELGDSVAVRVIEVDNGDLGMSRNDGVAHADGEFIAIVDGDNLISESWLVRASEVLRSSAVTTVVHPEVIISFGARHTFWRLQASTDVDFRPELLAVVNPWDACVMARRRVFEDTPYLCLPPSEGFGPEDWSWNLATLEGGVAHVLAPETAMFYRVRADSLLSKHGNSLLPRLEFLSSAAIARRVVDQFGIIPAQTSALREAFRRLVPYRLRRVARDAGRKAKRIVSLQSRREGDLSSHGTTESEWLRAEWLAANRFEPEVPFPRPDDMSRYHSWGAPWSDWDHERALAYWRVLAAMGAGVDFVFIAPWVRTGGGDRVMLQYIDAVRRLRPGANLVLVTTEPELSSRLQDVPADVRVVELRSYLSGHVDREWIVDALLPQILVQVAPRTIHVFNSTVGFDVVERYGRALSRDSAIFVSTFVLDRTSDGERTSVLFYRHPRFLDPIEAVLVDSEAFASVMVREAGFDRDKFRVHRQIVPDLPPMQRAGSERFESSRPLRVLWVGRFDLQKRLDILAGVAEEARRRALPVLIDFFGEPVMGDPALEAHLERLEAAGARRHAAYGDIAELSLDEFDVFLMTSEWEGVPNALLEMMSAGMPVVAPLVGGVPEVLDDSRGYAITNFDSASEYVDSLERILIDHADAVLRADRARQFVHSEFSVRAFDQRLLGLSTYLNGRAQLTAPDPVRGTVSFFADPETSEFLTSVEPRVYVFTGSGGYANFGDILQPKNVLHLWSVNAPDVTTVVFFQIGAARSPEHLESLRAAYRTRQVVFFRSGEEPVPSWLAEVHSSDAALRARLHVVGGGFLNAEWGVPYLEVIDRIADTFGDDQVLFSGMQVDEFILPHLSSFAERHTVVSFGTRDERSYRRAQGVFGRRAIESFDDLHEAIAAWAPPARMSRRPGPLRLGLHINASDYVGGASVVSHVQGLLDVVTSAYPDVELTLLQAYDDRRPEVVDTLASLRLFGDEFPFERFATVDLARVALDWNPDAGSPRVIETLDLDAAITCSYHTTMLMHTIGVPAYLVRLNPYYEQKAEIFDLPSDFAAFLAEPSRYLRAFSLHTEQRSHWRGLFARWARGDAQAWEDGR